nr:hypothetical protein CFP56_64586 [Quercus suber]
MGNCCGKQTDDSFTGEGRTLGASPAAAPPSSTKNARAPAPPPSRLKGSTSGGRTLGDSGASEDPKTAAARAAEERARAAQGKGKLGKQLDAQKGQTQASVLAQTARDNVAAREADSVAQTRSYN